MNEESREEAKTKAEALIEEAAAVARALIDEAADRALAVIAEAVERAKEMLRAEEGGPLTAAQEQSLENITDGALRK